MCKGRLQYSKIEQNFDRFSFFVILYRFYFTPLPIYRGLDPPPTATSQVGNGFWFSSFFFFSSHIVFSLTWTLGDNVKQGGPWLRLIWVSALSEYRERETSHRSSITVEIFHLTNVCPHTRQRLFSHRNCTRQNLFVDALWAGWRELQDDRYLFGDINSDRGKSGVDE